MKVISNYSLLKNNTFRMDVLCKYFVEISSIDNLREILKNPKYQTLPILILGDGANILFTKDFEGVVLHISLLGKRVIAEDDTSILLEVCSGENWNDLVHYAVNSNWGGIENLISIPGKVGAAPVQNIAAYGQNLSDVFVSLEAYEVATGTIKTFSKKECLFGYRTSIFKSKFANKWVILSIQLRLFKNAPVNTSYFETGKTYSKKGSLEQELSTFAHPPYSISDVSRAVASIREKKLPDIRIVGTAGSFFKNPLVSVEKYEELKLEDPDIQCYPVDQLVYPKVTSDYLQNQKFVKIPAARLIDNLGWRGKHIGSVGCYENQALAIVNYGDAKPEEIIKLYKDIQKSVESRYGIHLEPEVHII